VLGCLFVLNIAGFIIVMDYCFLDGICAVISDVFLSLCPQYGKDSESVLCNNKRRCSIEKGGSKHLTVA